MLGTYHINISFVLFINIFIESKNNQCAFKFIIFTNHVMKSFFCEKEYFELLLNNEIQMCSSLK
jgi:hypothetical protein